MIREHELVELVDADGVPVGTATVADAHTAPGRLHRAFSVLLLDDSGRLLLQQRSAAKTRFALRWANACCGHPGPDEPLVTAANRRLRDELGLGGIDLVPVGVYVYRAPDPATDRVEHEYDHVLVGRLDGGPAAQPDPDEVAALRWVPPAEVAADIAATPARYAPWLAGVLAVWRSSAREWSGGG